MEPFIDLIVSGALWTILRRVGERLKKPSCLTVSSFLRTQAMEG